MPFEDTYKEVIVFVTIHNHSKLS